MKIFGLIFIFFLSSIGGQTAFAQRQSVFVAPQTTDANISTNLNNHYVSINRAAAPKNRLFLFFPGTGGVAFNYQEINNTAADLGFHAITLTYLNDEAVNSLCGGLNTDLNCYADVRLETKDGVDRTALIDVNRPNSIENRLIKLLIYLRNQSPNDDWGQFLINDQTINWAKIVVSGHSQGGGHAAIIARYHQVARVVMFAAMDFNGRSNAPANWIAVPNSTPNATAAERFWGFSHQRDDQVNFTLLSNRIWTAFGMPSFGTIVNVDAAAPPYNNTHSLTSNLECDNFHGCVAADARLVRVNGIPVFKPVWEYLLSNINAAPLNLSSIRFLRSGQIVNRPLIGTTTKYFRICALGAGFDANSKILVRNIEMPTEFVNVNEVCAALPPGKIGRVGGTEIYIRNQNGISSNVLAF